MDFSSHIEGVWLLAIQTRLLYCLYRPVSIQYTQSTHHSVPLEIMWYTFSKSTARVDWLGKSYLEDPGDDKEMVKCPTAMKEPMVFLLSSSFHHLPDSLLKHIWWELTREADFPVIRTQLLVPVFEQGNHHTSLQSICSVPEVQTMLLRCVNQGCPTTSSDLSTSGQILFTPGALSPCSFWTTSAPVMNKPIPKKPSSATSMEDVLVGS